MSSSNSHILDQCKKSITSLVENSLIVGLQPSITIARKASVAILSKDGDNYRKLDANEELGALIGVVSPTGFIPSLMLGFSTFCISPFYASWIQGSRYITSLSAHEEKWLTTRGIEILKNVNPSDFWRIANYIKSNYSSSTLFSSGTSKKVAKALGIPTSFFWRQKGQMYYDGCAYGGWSLITDEYYQSEGGYERRIKCVIEYLQNSTNNSGKRLYKNIFLALWIFDMIVIDCLLLRSFPLDIAKLVDSYKRNL